MPEQPETLGVAPRRWRGVALAGALRGDWVTAPVVAAAVLVLLISASLVGAWVLRDSTTSANVPGLTGALVGLAFGSRVKLQPPPSGEDMPDDYATYLSVHPLTLTLLVAVGIGGAALVLRRRQGVAAVTGLGVKAGLLLAAGVAGIVRWGQRSAEAYAATPHTDAWEPNATRYGLVVKASATAATVGALVVVAVAVLAAVVVTAMTTRAATTTAAATTRAATTAATTTGPAGLAPSAPSAGRARGWRALRLRGWRALRLNGWRVLRLRGRRVLRLLGGPVWVLTLAAVTSGLVAAVAALPHTLPEASNGQSRAVVALALPNATAALMSIGLGTGMSVTTLIDGDAGPDDVARRPTATHVVHVSALEHAWGPQWWLTAAFIVIIALAGLLLAVHCRRPGELRRTALVAGALTLGGTAGLAALSGVDYDLDVVFADAWIGVHVPALRLGVWTGLLVVGATMLAGQLRPYLPAGLVAALTWAAGGPRGLRPATDGEEGAAASGDDSAPQDGSADPNDPPSPGSASPGRSTPAGQPEAFDLGLWLPDPPRRRPE